MIKSIYKIMILCFILSMGNIIVSNAAASDPMFFEGGVEISDIENIHIEETEMEIECESELDALESETNIVDSENETKSISCNTKDETEIIVEAETEKRTYSYDELHWNETASEDDYWLHIEEDEHNYELFGCDADGMDEYICSRCGDGYYESCKHETEPIEEEVCWHEHGKHLVTYDDGDVVYCCDDCGMDIEIVSSLDKPENECEETDNKEVDLFYSDESESGISIELESELDNTEIIE